MRIRPATASDEPAIRACVEEAYASYLPLIGRRPAPMEADYGALIAAGRAHVAEEAGRILGILVIVPREDHLLLENVAVRKAVAGRGVGRALVAFCESEARRLGFGSVRLYTNAAMAENLAIYPHLGYVETARRREDGFDRVYFEKPLA